MVSNVSRSRRLRRRWVEPTAARLHWRIIINLLLLLLTVLFVIPFLLILVASFTDEVEIAAKGFQFFPKHLTLYNYQYLFGASDKFLTALRLTGLVTVIGTLNTLFFTSLGAYALSRRYLPYRKGLTLFVFITMLISGGLIPWYLVVTRLGMSDSIYALFIPGTIATWNLIIMRNSFSALPDSLEDSAKIDGAGDFTVFFRIIVPISMPILSTMVVYLAIGYWNEWYANMLFIIRRNDLRSLQYLLREILNTNASLNSRGAVDIRTTAERAIPSESLKMASVMVATLPILAVYPFFQRYFIHGIMIGSIKE
ncbi:MAG: carbohydrate ABC transporter permease [Christensenellales bacterium]